MRDVEYQCGLREAASRGVDYGVALLEGEVGQGPQAPIALLAQARLAARQSIPLEVVIKRYLSAKTLLDQYVLREAADLGGPSPTLLQIALSTHQTAFDRLLSAVIDEYKQEEHGCQRSSVNRQLEQVRSLLTGDLIEPSALDYDLDRDHLGVVVGSPNGRQIIRLLAAETDTRSLTVRATQAEAWGWLGSREPLDAEAVGRLAARASSPSAPIGLGEPAHGRGGWRLSHRQARAALLVARAAPSAFARYAEVSMVVAAAESPLMATSLQKHYLAPLREGRNEGAVLRATLRAYFAANRNSKSAASALEVSRQTVANRLGQVEARLGQPLSMCADAVDAALRMEELGFLTPR
ncbi:MAG TPA: helix-turn-helix domain-containing protein [Solirubrobacterales bacterium]|nr:helix-turn-helix domain-containing protein [Solirubrobacterales bacterium]